MQGAVLMILLKWFDLEFFNLDDCIDLTWFAILWHSGSRPAGELLFLQQHKKSNQKNAALHRLPREKHSGFLNY